MADGRPPSRIPRILEKLQAYWSAFPDLRLGQIIGQLVRDSTPMQPGEELLHYLSSRYSDLLNIEDDKMEQLLDLTLSDGRLREGRTR